MIAVAAVAIVPVAGGQNAGDEQYGDPFDRVSPSAAADEVGDDARPLPKPKPAAGATGASSGSGSVGRDVAPIANPQPPDGRLARTGLDLRPFMLVGLLLVGCGLFLLRRSRTAGRY